MASVTGSDELVTKTDLSTFYQGLLPYLGGMPEAVANKFSRSDIYSTTEKMIGTWTDGKPLYQKTIDLSSVSLSLGKTEISLTSYIGNKIDKLFIVNSQWLNTSNSTKCSEYIVISNPTSSGHFLVNTYVTVSSTGVANLYAFRADGSDSDKLLFVTLQYTKTTDSATSIGVDTDYSTTEKIIGTWIDGKPIYQKTFQKTIPTTTSGTQTSSAFAVGASVDTLVNIIATAVNSSGSAIFVPNFYPNNSTGVTGLTSGVKVAVRTNSYTTSSDRNKVNIFNVNMIDLNGCPIYITLQYTKV